MMVAVTDGKDQCSTRFKEDPKGCGHAVAQTLAACNTPVLPVLVGVGSDRQIDHDALKLVADNGEMVLKTLGDFSELGGYLLRLATEIRSGVCVSEVRWPGASIIQTRPEIQIRSVPYAYVLLLDRSGSMSEVA